MLPVYAYCPFVVYTCLQSTSPLSLYHRTYDLRLLRVPTKSLRVARRLSITTYELPRYTTSPMKTFMKFPSSLRKALANIPHGAPPGIFPSLKEIKNHQTCKCKICRRLETFFSSGRCPICSTFHGQQFDYTIKTQSLV